jgi:Protein  of unknown function (DUF3018)
MTLISNLIEATCRQVDVRFASLPSILLEAMKDRKGVTYMASKRSAAHESVRVYRARMKQQGSRQVSILVPDTKSPKFRKDCRRQSRLASAADQLARLDELLNAAARTMEGWT